MKAMKKLHLLLIAGIVILTVLPYGCKKDNDHMDDDDNMPPDTTDTLDKCMLTLPASQTTPWPAWIFYHWVWEDESTQQSAQALVDDYLAHDIPVGAIIIDSPWETGYNTFEWDPALYPDAQGMIDYLHSKDVRVIMWITSAINLDAPNNLYNAIADSGFFFYDDTSYTTPEKIEWWKGRGSLIDYFNPDAAAWWKKQMDKTLAMGIDGWKCDGTDFQSTTGYSQTLGRRPTRQEYSDEYYYIHYNYTRQVLGNDRMITARPVDNYGIADIGTPYVQFAPKDINWAGWVGDQDATFDGLKAALSNLYWSAQAGYLAFGSDIGGYRTDSASTLGRTKELFLRWAQLGAMCPIMENGGAGEHRPWEFDTETADIYRKFVKLHHELVPYFMQEAEHFYALNESMMQFFNKTDYSYMLGRDIFVAPFLEMGTSISVNFPSGGPWVYAFDTTQVYQGGTNEMLTIGLEDYPIFIEDGSPLMQCVDFGAL